MNLPKRWLIHSINYSEYQGKNDWGDDAYALPVEIKNVRFDDSTVFSRDANQNKVVADAVVFVDTKHSNPVPSFIERSKIEFNGREYVLKKVIPCYYPNKDKIRHYELEVL